MPKVSVIIPAYNAGNYIGQCLDSVRAQTLSDIEILAVDDGSTDDTRRIIEKQASQDGRIRFITQKNQFAGVARNNGMEQAEGDFLYFLDADDYIVPNCLELMVAAAERFSAECVVARANYHDNENGNEGPLDYAMCDVETGLPLSQSDLAPHLFQAFKGWPWDKLFNSSFIRETQLRYQDLRTSNDALFVFVAMAQARIITCIDDHVVFHRISNAKSLANTRNRSWACAIEAASAMKDELVTRNLFAGLAHSYENWIADFFCWHLSTLDDESASAFLNKAQPILDGLSSEPNAIDNPRDAFFMRTIRSERATVISLANRQFAIAEDRARDVDALCREIDKLHGAVADLSAQLNASNKKVDDLEQRHVSDQREQDRLEHLVHDIYESKSYRIGNALVRSANAIRNLPKKRRAK